MLNLPNIKPYTRNLPFFGRNLDLTLTSRIHTSQGHCTRKAQKLVTFNWYYVGDEHFLPFIEVSLFHLKNKRTKKTIFKVNNEMRKGLKKDVHGRGKKQVSFGESFASVVQVILSLLLKIKLLY